MRFHRMLKGEDGFSLAELLVAGLIIAVALVPMIRMFDTTFRGIFSYERIHKSANCARAAVERVRSLPFYVPYNESQGDRDIDDFFWGDRDPIGSNPKTVLPEGGNSPDWERIPEVVYYDYGEFTGYEKYRVTVQLSYLNTDTGVAEMFSEWGPKKVGNDRPRNSDNEMIHLLLVHVNAYWQADGSERKYSLEQVVTDTDTVYNVGVSRIAVTGPSEVMDPERENAAAHYPDKTISVDIYGYGLKAGEGLNKAKGLRAYLVRAKYNDIPISLRTPTPRSVKVGEVFYEETIKEGSIAVLMVEGEIIYERVEGTLTLYNTGTSGVSGEPNFYPRAAVGYWSVKVAQEEIINSYLFNGFIVEYPRPTVTQFGNNDASMSLTGRNDESAKQLKIIGKNFITKVKNPTPVLVLYGANNTVLDQVTGTVNSITGTTNYGYSEAIQTMLATFDLTKASPGRYRLVVYNTDPGRIGHVSSVPSTQEYIVEAVPPRVTDVYVAGTEPKLRLAYKNIDFGKIRLAITGSYFNVLDPYVEVYISDSTTGDPKAGNWARGTLVNVGKDLIIADFDVTQLPAKDNAYNAFVLNLNTGLWGWITTGTPRLSVRTYNGNITSFQVTSPTGFWENYYDIPCRVTGSGLDAVIALTIAKGTTEYRDIEYTVVDSTRIDVNLNLIDCESGTWELRANITPTYYMKINFTVSLGKAVILDPQRTPMYAISIDRRTQGSTTYSTDYEYEYYSWGTWRVRRATAERSTNITKREARFTVRGKGFPVSGTTTLMVWYGTWSKQGDYPTITDRSKKYVYISSEWWEMPTYNDVYCGISVRRSGDTADPDSHDDRWFLD